MAGGHGGHYTWSEALKLVTGHDVDLRALCDGGAMIVPTVIWANKDPDSGASLTMDNNAGQPAIDRLVQELDRLSEIIPSVQEARHGLMDIEQLRAASAVVHRETTALANLNASAHQLASEARPSADGSDGQYRHRLAIALGQLQAGIATEANAQSAGSRPAASVVDDAAVALSAFGRRMARAFYLGKPELVQVATTFWDGANTNLRAYWQANGWGPGGPNSRLFRTAPDTAETRWRAAIAAYSSAGLPGLPAGTPTITADLMDGWDAFGSALTRRLGQVLDTMDEEATSALSDLASAYRAVIGILDPSASVDETPPLAGATYNGALFDPMRGSPPIPLGATVPSVATPMTHHTDYVPDLYTTPGVPPVEDAESWR